LVTLLAIAWWFTCVPAVAADATRGDEVLDEILVTGEQPGPAMWRLSKGEHSMWIMGTLAPLPAKMTWRSKQVENVIQQSGEILGSTSARATTDMGFFGTLRLLPAIMRLRKNPDGATLQAALAPEVFARFSAQYRRFFGKDPDRKDDSRPLMAADELFDEALKKSGLVDRSPVWPTVQKLARQHKVRIRTREIEMPVEDPKGLIAELSRIPRDKEVACLVLTMDYIDRELPNIKRRAAAWTVGDLATLRALPPAVDRTGCVAGLLESLRPQLQQQVKDITARIDADRAGIFSWMLLTHETSFTALPIERLLAKDDLVARWRAAGYTVEEPN
jgi:uncharacterized protein YbaP (TraB family)